MANNVKGGYNAVVAKQTISFVDAGVTAINTEIVYLVDTQLLSYVPGRAINGISGFVANKGYYMVAKVDMDLSAILVPPLSGITQLNTPANFTATPASSSQINLSWDAVSNATAYVIDRATNSGFTTGLVSSIYNGSATSFNATGLADSTTYYFRVRATASGYTNSNYATVSGTTQAAGGSIQDVIWGELANTTAPGNGDLVSSSGSPAGGMGTKHLPKVNGNYVQATVQSSPFSTNACVLALVAADDADYRWSVSDNILLAAFYDVSGSLNTSSGPTNTSATSLGSIADGNIVRLEISGNNVLVKVSTNGGSSFTTLHTHTGVLSSVSNVFIKGILATGAGGINHAEGLGLTT